MNDNALKLRDLLCDILLIDQSAYRADLERSDVESWDSLAVVSIAVGVEEVFGYHLTPAEAVAVSSVPDIVRILESRGIHFS